MGIEEERLMMTYCTAAEGQKFQREATEFDKLINKLGSSPFPVKTTRKKK